MNKILLKALTDIAYMMPPDSTIEDAQNRATKALAEWDNRVYQEIHKHLAVGVRRDSSAAGERGPCMYFVILTYQNGKYVPMTSEDDEFIAIFNTEDEAIASAQNNMLGEAFGFEVFELGTGWGK